MRLVRFAMMGRFYWGIATDEGVHPLALEPGQSPFDGAELHTRGELLPWELVRLVAPASPSKIVCVGVNYRLHAHEMGRELPASPLLFLKPPSALNGPGAPIELPLDSKLVHHEGELGLVIGKRARHVRRDEAMEHLFGLTCFNDVTARDLQRNDVQFTRGKGFDTFACVGPWIVRGLDPRDLGIEVRVNGIIKQSGRTSAMLFDVATLIAFISRVMTLEPGDVIATGTPEGVGPLVESDRVEVAIEGIGTLENPVVASPYAGLDKECT